MAYTEARKKATSKYVKKNLDDIKIRVPKGEKEIYHQMAKKLGYSSFNKFVIQAMDEKIAKDSSINSN